MLRLAPVVGADELTTVAKLFDTHGHQCQIKYNYSNYREGLKGLKSIPVGLGIHNLYNYRTASDQYVNATDVHIHPSFGAVNTMADIALLKLSKRVAFSREVQPICFDSSKASLSTDHCVVSGWNSSFEESKIILFGICITLY